MCGRDRLGYTALVRQIRRLYYHSQHAEGGCLGHRKSFKTTHSEIEFEGILKYIRAILTLDVLILYLFCSFIIISTSVVTGSHLLTRMNHYRLRPSDPK